jgi:hypothetical protein
MLARVAIAAVVAALRTSAAAFLVFTSGHRGLSGVTLANAAQATSLLAVCKLTFIV